jgi:hypothetical protein
MRGGAPGDAPEFLVVKAEVLGDLRRMSCRRRHRGDANGGTHALWLAEWLTLWLMPYGSPYGS